MTSIQAIQFFVGLNFFVIGLSHFFQPKIWIEFFEFLHRKGNVGNIFNGMMALAMGTLILSFHFVWKWPMLLVTLYGLSQFLKGLIYLVFPSVGIKSIGNVNSSSRKFKWVGLIMFACSILLFYKLVNDGIY